MRSMNFVTYYMNWLAKKVKIRGKINMKICKILIQIFIDILVMIGLLYLMAHLMTHLIAVYELTIVISGLFGMFTGLVIITIWQVIYIMFDKWLD